MRQPGLRSKMPLLICRRGRRGHQSFVTSGRRYHRRGTTNRKRTPSPTRVQNREEYSAACGTNSQPRLSPNILYPNNNHHQNQHPRRRRTSTAPACSAVARGRPPKAISSKPWPCSTLPWPGSGRSSEKTTSGAARRYTRSVSAG